MYKTIILPFFDPNIIVRGPVIKQKGRRYVSLYFKDSKLQYDITYAKYILSFYLERLLSREETVDHYDRNHLNDSLFNLRCIVWDLHIKDDVARCKNNDVIDVFCAICKTPLQRKACNTRRGKPGPFCIDCKFNTSIKNTLPAQNFIYSELIYLQKEKNETIKNFERAKKLDLILPKAIERLKEMKDKDSFILFRSKSFKQIKKINSKNKRNNIIKYKHFDINKYGVSLHEDKGTKYICVYDMIKKSKKKMRYAQFLLEQKLNRELRVGEKIKFLDGNIKNYSPENLDIV